MISKTIFVALAAITFAQNAWCQMGPLNLDLLDAGNCDPAQYVAFELSSLSDTQRALTVNVSLPFDLDSSVSYSVVVDKIADGEVQEGVFRHGGTDFCVDMEKYLGDIFTKISKHGGMNDGCPKKKGNYFADKFPIDYNDIKLEKFLYGQFILNIKIMRMGKAVSCVYIEFTNTPEGES